MAAPLRKNTRAKQQDRAGLPRTQQRTVVTQPRGRGWCSCCCGIFRDRRTCAFVDTGVERTADVIPARSANEDAYAQFFDSYADWSKLELETNMPCCCSGKLCLPKSLFFSGNCEANGDVVTETWSLLCYFFYTLNKWPQPTKNLATNGTKRVDVFRKCFQSFLGGFSWIFVDLWFATWDLVKLAMGHAKWVCQCADDGLVCLIMIRCCLRLVLGLGV